MGIVIAILVFGLIIVIHELGHFFAARACGILVEEFSIGMGPKLFGIKRGETLFSLRLFPIGGSCRMLGDDSGNSDKPDVDYSRSFNAKSVPKRIIVISAGIIMNLLLALISSFAFFTANSFVVPSVASLIPGSPAEAAGLMPGDKLVRINGKRIGMADDVQLIMDKSNGDPIELEVSRSGKTVPIVVVPEFSEESQSYRMGFYYEQRNGLFASADREELEIRPRAGFFETLSTSVNFCVYSVTETYKGLGQLITREVSVDQMSGPIGITNMIGDTYEQSMENSDPWLAFWNILLLVMFLSVSLAVFNFLPLPALDGGRIIFLLIEAVRGKPVNPEKEGMIHFAGFVLLIIFAVFVAYNDILKLI